jgi:PAS domain S-box-containing protein
MLATPDPESTVETAIAAFGCDDWKLVLDEMSAPLYVTDPEGWVSYANRPAAELAGREPKIGEDRWCVTFSLRTATGEPLAHEQCPMARALKERRRIRDTVVIAERPDGRRHACRVFPTPIEDAAGELAGGINVLIDVTREQSVGLGEQAARCRRIARSTHDAAASAILESMAREYEATAQSLSD